MHSNGPVSVLSIRGHLLVSLQVDLPDSAAQALGRDLREAVHHTGARGVLLDVSGLLAVDTVMAGNLERLANELQLLGARVVLVGMTPAIAMTFTDLGLTFPGIATARSVDAAMETL